MRRKYVQKNYQRRQRETITWIQRNYQFQKFTFGDDFRTFAVEHGNLTFNALPFRNSPLSLVSPPMCTAKATRLAANPAESRSQFGIRRRRCICDPDLDQAVLRSDHAVPRAGH